MDKLAYAANNFQLRLAGILMDMWIFFLFVAIAGKFNSIVSSSFILNFSSSSLPSSFLSSLHVPFDIRLSAEFEETIGPLTRPRCIDSTSGSQRDSVRVLSLDVSIRITYAQQARAAR